MRNKKQYAKKAITQSLYEKSRDLLPGAWRAQFQYRIKVKLGIVYSTQYIYLVVTGQRKNDHIEDEFVQWIKNLKKKQNERQSI